MHALMRCEGLVLICVLQAAVLNAQLTDTCAVGSVYSLYGTAPWVVEFKPVGSKAFPSSSNLLTPDVAGSYVLSTNSLNGANRTVYLQAVEVLLWSKGTAPLMADRFEGNSPSDSSSGYKFWQVLDQETGCQVTEARESGLSISSGSSSKCGIKTRNPCSPGAAARGCGYCSGATTLNPFADHILVSLLNMTLPTSSSTENVVSLQLNGPNTSDTGISLTVQLPTVINNTIANSNQRNASLQLSWWNATSSTILYATMLPAACYGTCKLLCFCYL
jgi:hypothetical protein